MNFGASASARIWPAFTTIGEKLDGLDVGASTASREMFAGEVKALLDDDDFQNELFKEDNTDGESGEVWTHVMVRAPSF